MAENIEKTPLEIQIEEEEKELREAPVIRPIVGSVRRCHICGAVYAAIDLKPFDTHIPNEKVREAGPCCHPERGL